MAVHVQPMPRSYLKISEKYRPGHPPIYDGAPTPGELEELHALLEALDPESQRWYRYKPDAQRSQDHH